MQHASYSADSVLTFEEGLSVTRLFLSMRCLCTLGPLKIAMSIANSLKKRTWI